MSYTVLQLYDIAQRIQSSEELTAIAGLLALVVGVGQYYLGPKHDWVESVRRRYWLKLNEVLSTFGGYSAGPERNIEYVCTVEVSEDELERALYRGGYHRNVVAALKYREVDGGRVPSEGSWVHRSSIFDDKQGHARFYESQHTDGLDVFHHYETSWVTHPIKHYYHVKMEVGDPQGTLKSALDYSGINYTKELPDSDN